MNDAQIKHMVDLFLNWRLPDNFSPDGGISFNRYGNEGTPHQYEHRPSGTNLLDAVQAEVMVRHMAEGMPPNKIECSMPHLGLATTRELLDELRARKI